MSLQNDLSVALQFGKMTIDQASQIHAYDIPPNIAALDARLIEGRTDAELDDIEYQFKVVYTLYSASKSKSHIQFFSPHSEEGKDIHNVLQKYRISDEMYPLKPGDVVKKVKAAGKTFSMKAHTDAWKKHKARPGNGAKKPDRTDNDFCIYHSAHKDYTYNQAWVEKLILEAPDKPKLPIHPFFVAALDSADNENMNVDVQMASE